MSTELLSQAPASLAPHTALAARNADEGLQLAQSLARELFRVWRAANPPLKDPAALLNADRSAQLDLGTLISIQFSLIAAANNYWRPS
jgi:hypothetical protein